MDALGQQGPPPRQTQQQRRAATERRLLDAALTLIAQTGSRAMSTAQVGESAGYSRGIVTHQFGSKRELLQRAVQRAQELVDVPPTESGLGWVLELADRYLRLSGNAATRAFLVMWGEAIANDDNVRDIYIERDTWFRSLISTAVAEGITEGSVRPDVDPGAFAYLLVALVRGSALQLMLTPDPAIQAALRTECAELVTRHLAATDRRQT